MKLQYLRDVVTIAELGSLRAAARHLEVAQPLLTRRLSEIERELGAPVFERRSSGMIATPLGNAFIRRANTILNDLRHAQDEFQQSRGNAAGTVTVGFSIVPHLSILPKILQPFKRKYPKVHLRIMECHYPTLEQGLLDGSVDFFVGADSSGNLPPLLHKETLFAGRRAVLCRIGHPLANATSLEQLADAEWITTSITQKAEKEIGDLFRSMGLRDASLALQSQSALTLLTCLTNSDLLAMAPAQWMDSPLANRLLTTIKVKQELAAPDIVVVKRSDLPLTPAAGFLLDLVRRTSSPMASKRKRRSPR